MQQRARRGFLLIELGIAISILAVGMLALVGTIYKSVECIDKGKDTFYMTEIAKQKLDLVRGKAFNYIPSDGFVSLSTLYNGKYITSYYKYQYLIYYYTRNGTLVSNPTALQISQQVAKKVVVVTVTMPSNNESFTINSTNVTYSRNRKNLNVTRYVKMETSITRQTHSI
ncbi:MAG: prepilin-type N-terminal cleavage/methylation domain-containing protein [Candidatus Eremiobacteraeota bacterium]|nr:prepilin-type N-terminal cleavage/methylation domain-containing protein [Candidatus Eremiobacteraeota bacterium]